MRFVAILLNWGRWEQAAQAVPPPERVFFLSPLCHVDLASTKLRNYPQKLQIKMNSSSPADYDTYIL